MILTKLENASRYAGLHAGIAKVLNAAGGYTPENFVPGRVTLDGDKVFMNLSEYETHPLEGALSEAHRLYADVMIVLEGSETVYVKPAKELKHITREYDPSIEALLALTDEDVSAIRLEPGSVLILFPEDAHAPGCRADVPSRVKKIIGKVLLDAD